MLHNLALDKILAKEVSEFEICNHLNGDFSINMIFSHIKKARDIFPGFRYT